MSTPEDIRSHTAIHVLKGAVQTVLGAKWSASAYSSGSHGGLAVQFDRKPSDEEITKIEELANQKIKDNQPSEILELPRDEAEARFGNIIYDLFPIPETVKVLTIYHLPGWNINTCGKQHSATTGEIGSIKIVKWRFRANKNLLEFSFDVA